MKKNKFIINKYTVSLLILLLYLVTDVISHKGMSRVILPESFTNKRSPQNLIKCEQTLQATGQKWSKAINTVKKIEQLPAEAAGFESDVYFDPVQNQLHVYHDSMEFSNLKIEDLLDVYKARKLSSSVWLDFKNLSSLNEKKSLEYISALRKQYGLRGKMIVESSSPQFLQSFCDSGFFTSYYTAFFNPYLLSGNELVRVIDTISANLTRYPTAALSGYYFQYPLLKKFFPNYPVLTWVDHSGFSLVSNIFNWMLRNDEQVKIVLHPF